MVNRSKTSPIREPPRIGVYICHCGTNIAGVVDVDSVTKFATGLEHVVIARNYPYMCSDPGQELIGEDIRQLNLDRVVVASCTPLMHETTFRRACAEAGMNPYLFQMANIREHCSWITNETRVATEKAEALVDAAVQRVVWQEPLEMRQDGEVPARFPGNDLLHGLPHARLVELAGRSASAEQLFGIPSRLFGNLHRATPLLI